MKMIVTMLSVIGTPHSDSVTCDPLPVELPTEYDLLQGHCVCFEDQSHSKASEGKRIKSLPLFLMEQQKSL
jgi:hypothetical protein